MEDAASSSEYYYDMASAPLVRILKTLDDNSESDSSNTRWETLTLPPLEQDPDDSSPSSSSLLTPDKVHLLKPPSNYIEPTNIIYFIGGAALGQFPQVAYGDMLQRISDRTGAAVIAVPYEVGLDHFEIAKNCYSKCMRALQYCQDQRRWSNQKPSYILAHSLGAKLTLINLAATKWGSELEGVGLMSFNNFGVAGSIGMAKSFISAIQSSSNTYSQTNVIADQLFDFAQNFISGVGIEFNPSPDITKKLIHMKILPEMIAKIRLFSFENDNLDSSEDILSEAVEKPEVARLPGTHLTPVYLKLSANDAFSNIGDASIKETMKGFVDSRQAISFGDDTELNQLVTEIERWLMGKEPQIKNPLLESSGRKESSSG